MGRRRWRVGGERGGGPVAAGETVAGEATIVSIKEKVSGERAIHNNWF